MTYFEAVVIIQAILIVILMLSVQALREHLKETSRFLVVTANIVQRHMELLEGAEITIVNKEVDED